MKIVLEEKSAIVSVAVSNGAELEKMAYCEATLILNGVEIKSNIYLS